MKVELGSGWGNVNGAYAKLLQGVDGADLFDIINAGAEVVVDYAVQVVPVDTGELRDSIGIQEEAGLPVINVEAEHAEAVEFGTSNMEAQPYIRPALARETEIADAMAAVLADKQREAENG